MNAMNWRRVEKNTLRGFFDLVLPSGIVVKGCTFHRKDDASWVGLPASPQLDRDGKALITPKTGKIAYTAVIEIPDRPTRDKFQAQALAAVERLLAGGGGAP